MRTFLSLSLLLPACLKPYPVDWDGDGVKASEDCDDLDADLGSRTLDPDCDGLDTGSIDTDDADSGDTNNDTAIEPSLSVDDVLEISTPTSTGFGIKLIFSLEYPAEELSNNELVLSVGIGSGSLQQRTFQIPTDITDGTSNQGEIEFALRPCELLGDMTWTLELEDPEGGTLSQSGSLRNSFSGPPGNQAPRYFLLEEALEDPQNTFHHPTWQDRGDSPFEPLLPHLFCGDIESTATGDLDGDTWPEGADVDFIKLTHTPTHTATLYATNSKTVFDFGRFYQPYLNAGNYSYANDTERFSREPSPLSFNASSVPNQFQYIRGYSGEPTDYWVILRE